MLIINTRKDTYHKEEAALSSITVGELINFLRQFDDDEAIVLSFNNGYTYGRLSEYRIEQIEEEEEDDIE